jgi:hypothetical protein
MKASKEAVWAAVYASVYAHWAADVSECSYENISEHIRSDVT